MYWEELLLSLSRKGLTSKIGVLTCALASITLSSPVNAGGFDYFQNDYSLLFTPSNAVEFGFTYVAPDRSRKNSVRNGLPAFLNDGGDGGNYAEDFTLPTATIKYNLNDNLDCMGSYRSPYGTHQDTGETWTGRYYAVKTDMTNKSYNLDCMYSFDLGDGRFGLIGGVRKENSEVILSSMVSSSALLTSATGVPTNTIGTPLQGADSRATLDAKSGEVGYTLGASYRLPSAGFRISAIYQSEIEHNYEGTSTVDVNAAIALNPLIPSQIQQGASASLVTSPQSLQINASKQLEGGWGVLGFLRWVDWSKTQQLDVLLQDGRTQTTQINWKDGWTYGVGVSKLVNAKLAVYGVVSYDQDTSTDDLRGPRSGTFNSFTGTLGATIGLTDNAYLKLSGSYKRALATKMNEYEPPLTDGIADPFAGASLSAENDDSDIWVAKAVFGFTF